LVPDSPDRVDDGGTGKERWQFAEHFSGLEEIFSRRTANQALIDVVVEWVCYECEPPTGGGPEQVLLGRQVFEIGDDVSGHRFDPGVARRRRRTGGLLIQPEVGPGPGKRHAERRRRRRVVTRDGPISGLRLRQTAGRYDHDD